MICLIVSDSRIEYPNPTARVGPGVDGLDHVRQVFRLLPRLLAASGETVIRFDVPLRSSGDNPLRHEVEALQRCGCSIDFTVLGEISAGQQSEISAETCWHLNRNMPGLAQRFVAHYPAYLTARDRSLNFCRKREARELVFYP